MFPELRGRDVAGAALVAVVTLAIDVPLLPSGVWIGDQAEAQTAPYVLGIMHPTGFPLFTLTGWAFSHAVAIGSVAWRLNLFSAVLTALAAAGVVLLARALGSGLGAAVFAGCAYAFGNVVWSGAIAVNAQVLASTCSVFALAAAVAYARGGDNRILIVACALCGCGLATHPASVWIVPAIVVALLWQRRTLTRRAALAGAAALLLPLLLYAYLPLRSAAVAAPDAVAGQPSLAPQSLDWDSDPPRTLTGFLDKVLGRHERASSFVLQAFDPRGYGGAGEAFLHIAEQQYRSGLLLLAALGCMVLARRDPRALSVVLAGVAGGIVFAYAYRDDAHLDRYYAVAFAVTAALAAAASRLGLPGLPRNAARVAVALALAVIAGLAIANDRPDPRPMLEQDGEALIGAVARDTPSNAIVVAQWNEATALRYGAFVEHALDGRTIVVAGFSEFADRYPAWSHGRPLILFVPPPQSIWFGFRPGRIGELPSSHPPYRVFLVLPRR